MVYTLINRTNLWLFFTKKVSKKQEVVSSNFLKLLKYNRPQNTQQPCNQ